MGMSGCVKPTSQYSFSDCDAAVLYPDEAFLSNTRSVFGSAGDCATVLAWAGAEN